jgi:hypothetical protein
MIKIVKSQSACGFSSGRGMDNTATGGTYIILKDGEAVGSILPNQRRCFAASEWEVFEYTMDASGAVIGYKSLKRLTSIFDPKPFKQAKEFALNHFARIDRAITE